MKHPVPPNNPIKPRRGPVKVLTLLGCGCALISLVASAPAAAGTQTPAAATLPAVATVPPRAAVTSVCRVSAKAADRKFTIKTTMRPVSGTRRMTLELLFQAKKVKAAGFTTIDLPAASDFGLWLIPNPPTLGRNPNDVWHVSKTVVKLPTGYSYRVKVRFRWWGTGTKLLKQQALYTKVCTEPPVTKKAQENELSVLASG